ncbi:MAG: hypothetical protein JSU96_00240, partial [Acidobacteriota bacterium]
RILRAAFFLVRAIFFCMISYQVCAGLFETGRHGSTPLPLATGVPKKVEGCLKVSKWRGSSCQKIS